MRFNGLALAAAVLAMSACGGGDNAGSDSAAAPSAGTGAPAGAPAPITGTTHEVKMLGDEKGYRYEPVDITVKQGDGITWTMVSGQPHNVVYENVQADAKAQLSANMPNQLTDLGSPMMLNVNEKYTMSFAGVKPGKYDYVCQPHIANNMRGSVTVQ